jgi:hypothetical protein
VHSQQKMAAFWLFVFKLKHILLEWSCHLVLNRDKQQRQNGGSVSVVADYCETFFICTAPKDSI